MRFITPSPSKKIILNESKARNRCQPDRTDSEPSRSYCTPAGGLPTCWELPGVNGTVKTFFPLIETGNL